jgi:hypothetical protein
LKKKTVKNKKEKKNPFKSWNTPSEFTDDYYSPTEVKTII